MPKEKKPRLTIEQELELLREVARDSTTKESIDRLRSALQSTRSILVARAANIIKANKQPGFAAALLQAFHRFLKSPVQSDPGCHAKLAAIEALDFTDHDDSEPFLIAARHIQMEPAWGPPVDTAANLRARALLALSRLAYPDLLLICGELLADLEAPVRMAAIGALRNRASRDAAGLLLLKLRLGDSDPMVCLACMDGLLALAPDWGLPVLTKLLRGTERQLRELAASSLGESGREDALALLLEDLEGSPLASERAVILRSLGLHRSGGALKALLSVIAEGSPPDAKEAISALRVRRSDPEVLKKALEAAQDNNRSALRATIIEQLSNED